ncbi:MAG: hypothetical protein ABIT08_15925 [Bacteroidia bacterium]
MKLRWLVFLLVINVSGIKSSFAESRKPIDVVICMDLSGSTNGLLDDVRDMYWDLVNQVNTYRPQPHFRIGLVGFSRPSFGRDNGFVKILAPLTNDYELVAYELAKLKTDIEKGDQLVGAALMAGIKGMQWSIDQHAIKTIFLIGNGVVSLDKMKYKEAYPLASQNNIIVNTIYCMSSNFKKDIRGWREIALNTNGVQYDVLVHKRNQLILSTDSTDRLLELNKKLTATYIYYGTNGKDFFKLERLTDKVAVNANEMTFQSRMFFKISDLYQLNQSHWDLVDHVKVTNNNLQKIDPSLLPDTLKKFTADALRALVARKKTERQKIIEQIRELLPYDRQKTINKKIKEEGYDKHPGTLDCIIISWLNKKAAEKGLETFVN